MTLFTAQQNSSKLPPALIHVADCKSTVSCCTHYWLGQSYSLLFLQSSVLLAELFELGERQLYPDPSLVDL